ncbi:T9SS type A sorting domain-containing protein, partial [Bacteroidota bacterium]
SPGYLNGTGTIAKFNKPWGIIIDSQGNLFVTEAANNTIRKITPSGVVTTFAGSTSPGFINGNGSTARFHMPYGICIDPGDTLYVVDRGNNAIRKITPSGNVSTIAGTGSSGFTNGPALTAKFDSPQGIRMDHYGKLYIADRDNHAIRTLFNGVVSTLAGTGISGYVDTIASLAQFDGPHGIAIDSAGFVYIGDSENNVIRRIDTNGLVGTYAGTGVAGYLDGPAASAQFKLTKGIVLNRYETDIFICDRGNNRIRRLNFRQPLGINNNNTIFHSSVYPIPASEIINIELKLNGNPRNIYLSLADITGRIIYSDLLFSVDDLNAYEINVNPLESGVYFLNIMGKDFRISKKILKQ